jgi:hypothetical protein
MLKICTMILCLFAAAQQASARSFAEGDYVNFTVDSDSSTLGQDYSLRVAEVRDQNTFGIIQAWSEADRPPLRSWLHVEQLEASLIGFSREHAQKYFSECAPLGGKLEMVSTQAGTFLACTIHFIDDPKNSYSVSPAVPFGIVRRVRGPDEGGSYQRFTLRSFDFGQD